MTVAHHTQWHTGAPILSVNVDGIHGLQAFNTACKEVQDNCEHGEGDDTNLSGHTHDHSC